MDDERSKIRLKRGENEIEAEGKTEFVESAISKYLPVLDGAKSFELKRESQKEALTDQVVDATLVEFLDQKDPTTHDDRFLVIAYWLTVRNQQEQFQADDIISGYSKASESKPKNPTQHMTANVRRAFFQREKEGFYSITKSGIEYVERNLPKHRSS